MENESLEGETHRKSELRAARKEKVCSFGQNDRLDVPCSLPEPKIWQRIRGKREVRIRDTSKAQCQQQSRTYHRGPVKIEFAPFRGLLTGFSDFFNLVVIEECRS